MIAKERYLLEDKRMVRQDRLDQLEGKGALDRSDVHEGEGRLVVGKEACVLQDGKCLSRLCRQLFLACLDGAASSTHHSAAFGFLTGGIKEKDDELSHNRHRSICHHWRPTLVQPQAALVSVPHHLFRQSTSIVVCVKRENALEGLELQLGALGSREDGAVGGIDACRVDDGVDNKEDIGDRRPMEGIMR